MTILPGLSLFIVLFFYRGFRIDTGVSFSGHSFFYRTFLFALTTSACFYLAEFHVRKLIGTLSGPGQLIFWLCEILTGAICTFLLFNYFWTGTEWNRSAFMLLLSEYFSVILIPLLLVRLTDRHPPAVTNVTPLFITLRAENGKHQIKIRADKLLYLKAADNYVEIHYTSGDSKKKELIRNTLKSLLTEETSAYLVRCHRSFAVNLNSVDRRIRRGQELILEVGGKEIPVSKKYLKDFVQS